jgi:trigger factor
MKVKIQKLSKSQIELKIEVPKEEFNNFIEKTILNLGRDFQVEGFRKGKVPKEIVEREIGQEKILAEASQLAIKKKYLQAVLENKIEPISQPEIEILKLAHGNDFEFRARTSILPEISLPDYKEISSKVKRNKVVVEEKEIEEAIIWLQKSRAKFSQISRPAQKGDFIEIEFTESIENKTHKDSFILGQGKFIPGFEENLKGMSKGEEKEFSLKLPQNYIRNDLAGQSVNFKVKVNSVQKMELPKLDDEFVKSIGQFDNLEAFRKNIKEGLLLEKEKAETQRIRQEIIGKIAEKSDFEIPEALVEKEKNQIMENLKKRVSQELKISFEDYLSKINKSQKELLDSFSNEAQKRIKTFLILREISKKEDIKVSSEEVEQEANKILKQYPLEAQKKIDLNLLKDYTKEELKNDKTFQLLESFIKV